MDVAVVGETIFRSHTLRLALVLLVGLSEMFQSRGSLPQAKGAAQEQERRGEAN
jgi:hypothetical protein